MKMNKSAATITACVAVVAVAATFFGAAFGGSTDTTEDTAEQKKIYVATSAPTIGDLSITGEYIGKIEPNQQVMVIPRMSGEALAVNFNVGDTVTAGDVLVELDDTDVALQVDIARAGYLQASASVAQATGGTLDAQVLQGESGYASAQNSYSTAIDIISKSNRNYEEQLKDLDDVLDQLSSAKSQTKRQRDNINAALAAKQQELLNLQAQLSLGASSGLEIQIEKVKGEIALYQQSAASAEAAYSQASSTYDSTSSSYDQLERGADLDLRSLRSQLDAAKIAADSAEKSLNLLNNRIIPEAKAVAEASLASAQAQLNASARQLDFTKITAPIGGIIEQRNIDEFGMVTPSSPVFVISNKDLMTVSFSVSEYVVNNISVGETVTVEKNDTTCTGTIVEVSSMVDQASGLFTVKVSIESAPFPTLTGTNVKIFADTEKAERSILIPIDAVYYDDVSPYVYILDNGIARKTMVETGISNAESIEILSGIGADTQIITTWNANLKDGAEVEVNGASSGATDDSLSEEEGE